MDGQAVSKKLKFIGCEIIYREACYLAATGPHMVDVEFLRKGLHDLETADMLRRVQQAVDAVDPAAGYEAILLGYGRCNDGLVGLTARGIPLVVPRVHDCITFFFGSRGAFTEYFENNPGTFYMTTGWSERNTPTGEDPSKQYGQTGVMGKLGLSQSYEELVSKYGKENADFIRESLGDWKKNYSRYLYLKMGICDETGYIDATQKLANDRNWAFELRDGQWTLLKKLFAGQWDDDFVIVPPGGSIIARNDERVLDAQPSQARKGS
jgi:hypothetical protein